MLPGPGRFPSDVCDCVGKVLWPLCSVSDAFVLLLSSSSFCDCVLMNGAPVEGLQVQLAGAALPPVSPQQVLPHAEGPLLLPLPRQTPLCVPPLVQPQRVVVP